MEQTFINEVRSELKKARDTWHDLPACVYLPEYEDALMEWIGKCIARGRTDINTLSFCTLYITRQGVESNRILLLTVVNKVGLVEVDITSNEW